MVGGVIAIRHYVSRNNLTVVDALIVSGKGASGNLYIKQDVSSKTVGTDLYYEVKESSLKGCTGMVLALSLGV